MSKTVSVVIPTYNRARFLKAAIDSVLRQTFQDIEIIVVDDKSTDNTREIVEAYGDRVKYILQENKERGAARNNGIIHSEGEYIALLDSDDLWLPNHLESCIKALRNTPDAALSFSGSYVADEEGRIISRMKLSPFNGYALERIVSRYSSGGCNASSCLIRKDIFNKAGYFSEDKALSGSEDWEMWARISAYAKIVSTNTYTVMVRFHKKNSSINADRMAKSMKMALDLIYGNPEILPKINNLKERAYSSLYAVTAINYYASGDMKNVRRFLRKAIESCPSAFFTNKYIAYTFLRSLLGFRISSRIRRAKWALGSKVLKLR